ncbi:cyclic nucleotide-binding domain-containing protein 2-like, partial [Saccoglossus kowalevskii]
MKPEEARRKFRKAVRVVLVNNAMNKVAVDYEERDTLLSFTAFAGKCKTKIGEETLTESLTFDKKYFKARKELRLSQDVKSFLTIGIKDRTPQQLKQVLHCLQSVKSFSEYPLYMQEKLCKVAFYHCIPPKRVIIRQGHVAESVYTLLSGQVIVTQLETDPVTKETVQRTVNVLRRGACFGEVALIHQSKRTATVTSNASCELLSVSREVRTGTVTSDVSCELLSVGRE